jgi:hypothetical protein
VAAVLFTAGFALASGALVTLTATGPQPPSVTINWGDTVTFTNGDTNEYALVSPGAGFTTSLPPGGTFTQAYQGKEGNYRFSQKVAGGSFNGRVIVQAQGEVTIKAASNILDYGQSYTITGKSSFANSPVTLSYRVSGGTGSWEEVATATTAEDGSFSIPHRPLIGGSYRATAAAGQVRSGRFRFTVRPRLTITKVSSRRIKEGARIVVSGRVVPPDSAKFAQLDLLGGGHQRWRRREVKPVRNGTVVIGWTGVPAGKNLFRLSINRGMNKTGYEPTESKSVVVYGIAPPPPPPKKKKKQ